MGLGLFILRQRHRKAGFADLFLLLLFLMFLHYFVGLARQWNGQFHPEASIDLSFSALPAYSFFSLIRAFAAYSLSLAFTIVYGYAAAKANTSERWMIPLLDIGQSIPVLGFMPGLVLGLIALFPKSNFGMELACILLIFTGQAWNMTFAFYASLRSVPKPFYEMSDIIGLTWWEKLRQIELPFSAVNLAWNSLMSMAGGWFFLIACESFTLGERRFRLPGLGSYMAAAIEKENTEAMIAGVAAMLAVILFTDFLVWRPIVAWTRKFRLEDVQDEIREAPFLTLLLKDSILMKAARQAFGVLRKAAGGAGRASVSAPTRIALRSRAGKRASKDVRMRRKDLKARVAKVSARIAAGVAIILLFWAFTRLWELIRGLSLSDWLSIALGAVQTFLRVLAALVLGSLWTVPFGIWVGRSQNLTRFFQPVIQLMASFPAPMLYPLVIRLFAKLGLGLPVGSAFLMLLGVQWYVLFNVLAGAIGISRDIQESLALIGVGRSYRWKEFYIPSIFPALVTGWVTAAGGAWNASVIAEYVQFGGSTLKAHGLGSLISEATASGNYPMLGGCLLVMVGAVVGLNRAVWLPVQRLAETRFRFER